MKTKLILGILILIVLPFVLGEGSGHKTVYGNIYLDDEPLNNAGVIANVVVGKGVLDWHCKTDVVYSADDGSYSIDLYTLKDKGGTSCGTYWKSDDEIWISAYKEDIEENSSKTLIQCYGDPNCGGSQQIEDLFLVLEFEEIEEGGIGGGVPGKEKEEEIDIEIIDIDIDYSEEMNIIKFLIVLKNNKDKEVKNNDLKIFIADNVGKPVFDFSANVDLSSFEEKKIELMQEKELKLGYYDATLFVYSRGKLLDTLSKRFFVARAEEKIEIPVVEKPQLMIERPEFSMIVFVLIIIMVVITAVNIIRFRRIKKTL